MEPTGSWFVPHTDDYFEPSPSRRISSEWHRIQPVEPRVHADGDFSKRGESPSAGINGRSSLCADWKPHRSRVFQVDLHGKLSLRLVRVCRIELRDDVARKILPFAVCPPDAVYFCHKNLAGIKV